MVGDLARNGWQVFPFDPQIKTWAEAALSASDLALNDPELAHWYQCENTWFVGVDALNNAPDGTLNGASLRGAVMDALPAKLPLHPAQLSVIWPGYPKPRAGETEAGFRYRQNRDAAHVDGIRAEGLPKRRFLKEPHAYILGLPLTANDPQASPLTVWDGSHHIMRRAFQAAFDGHDPSTWSDIDITDIYVAARREVFDTCKRIELPAQPGEATVTHRLSLHGVAPWTSTNTPDRRIAYFRPELPEITDWLDAP